MKFKDYVNEHCINEGLSIEEKAQNKRLKLKNRIQVLNKKIGELKAEESSGNMHFNSKTPIKDNSAKIKKLQDQLRDAQDQYVHI